MSSIKFEKGRNFNINDETTVKVTKYTRTKTLKITTSSNKKNTLQKYKKLNKYEYLDTETGEIKKYENNEYKTRESIRRSMNTAEGYLTNNFTGGQNELFVTLTVAAETKSIDDIKSSFNKFSKKLKSLYKGLEYVGVIEMQERECPHFHLLIKDIDHSKLFISNKLIQNIWKLGSTKTYPVNDKNIKKLIKYMTKIKSKEKLPASIKLFTKSKGIVAPTVNKMTYKEIKSELESNYQKNEEHTSLIISTNTNKILSRIKTESWIPKDVQNEKLHNYQKCCKAINLQFPCSNLNYFNSRLKLLEQFICEHQLLELAEKQKLCKYISDAILYCSNEQIYNFTHLSKRYTLLIVEKGQKFKIFEELMQKLGEIYISINNSYNLDFETKTELKALLLPAYNYIFSILKNNSIYPLKDYERIYEVH